MGEGISMEDIGKTWDNCWPILLWVLLRNWCHIPSGKAKIVCSGMKRPGRPGKSARCFGIFPKSGPQASWMYNWNSLIWRHFPIIYSMILNWPVWSVNARNALRHNWRFGPQFSARHQNLMLDPAAQFPSGTISTQTWRIGKSTIWWFFHVFPLYN